MGRQQITIENDAPIINNRTGNTNGGGNGALMNRPIPLPQAGWQPYAPVETPGINPNLPKVPGPIRQSHNVPGRISKKGHPGTLNAGVHARAAQNNGVRSYAPYAQYPEPSSSTQGSEDLEARTRVKGSLLHWARRKTNQP